MIAPAAGMRTQSNTVVFIAGTGTPPHNQSVLDTITDHLSSKGMEVKQLTGDASATRTIALETAKRENSQGLLFLTVDMGAGEPSCGRVRQLGI
jgi:hypothetical protein